jgi:hypothetical protein
MPVSIEDSWSLLNEGDGLLAELTVRTPTQFKPSSWMVVKLDCPDYVGALL